MVSLVLSCLTLSSSRESSPYASPVKSSPTASGISEEQEDVPEEQEDVPEEQEDVAEEQEETPDEIEKFIAEMEKDQEM